MTNNILFVNIPKRLAALYSKMDNMFKKLKLIGIFSGTSHKIDASTFTSSFSAANMTRSDLTNSPAGSQSSNVLNLKNKLKKLSNRKIILPTALVVAIIIGFIALKNITNSRSDAVAGVDDKKINIQQAKFTQTLNKEFLFPLKNAKGKEISKLKYNIQNVEIRDEIIVKGQKATAIKGRTFLIINLKITNDFDKSIQINARDYIRLIVNNSSEKLAPDIHNDPVEIQAISTKFTRLGFPINDTDKNLTLQVGEIDGKKELIKLNLK